MIITISGVTMNGGVLTPSQIKALTPAQLDAIRHQSRAPDPVTGELSRPILLPLSVLSGWSDEYIATHSIDNSSVPTITNNLDVGAKQHATNPAARAYEAKEKILQAVQDKGADPLNIIT